MQACVHSHRVSLVYMMGQKNEKKTKLCFLHWLCQNLNLLIKLHRTLEIRQLARSFKSIPDIFLSVSGVFVFSMSRDLIGRTERWRRKLVSVLPDLCVRGCYCESYLYRYLFQTQSPGFFPDGWLFVAVSFFTCYLITVQSFDTWSNYIRLRSVRFLFSQETFVSYSHCLQKYIFNARKSQRLLSVFAGIKVN